MRQAEKECKEFQTPIPLILDPGEKIPKKNSKKFEKIKKLNSGIISIQNGLREAKIEEKKNLDPNSVPSRPKKKIPKKIAKKFKKLKNPFLALFLARTG